MKPTQKFQAITNYDIDSFINDYLYFSNSQFSLIEDYYTGKLNQRPISAFSLLSQLAEEMVYIQNILRQYRYQLNNTIMWEIVEDLDDIYTRIQTAQNAAKWLRTSSIKNQHSQSPNVDYIMQQNQTIENVSSLVLKDSDGENNWKYIALNNQLNEEDYTYKGGTLLEVNLKGALSSFFILSVIDVINGKSVYGADIQQKIQFIENDLATLSFDQTILQSVAILLNFKRGDAPEYRDLGIQQSVAVGTTRGSLQFPAIFRQLVQVFSTDDSLKDFKLINLRFDQDALKLDFQINTRLDEVLNQTLTL